MTARILGVARVSRWKLRATTPIELSNAINAVDPAPATGF
jgi:hypothetical protein